MSAPLIIWWQISSSLAPDPIFFLNCFYSYEGTEILNSSKNFTSLSSLAETKCELKALLKEALNNTYKEKTITTGASLTL